MRTIDKIITPVNCQYGAPMGRGSTLPKEFIILSPPNARKMLVDKDTEKTHTLFDCRVPLSGCGAYDVGGAYWGHGAELRVSYTKDLSYVHFYRVGDE